MKQLKCLPTDEWIHKICVYTMGYYLAIKKERSKKKKRNKVLIHAKYMNFGNVMVSEISQLQRSHIV